MTKSQDKIDKYKKLIIKARLIIKFGFRSSFKASANLAQLIHTKDGFIN